MYFKKNLKLFLLIAALTLIVTGTSCTQDERHNHHSEKEQKQKLIESSIVHEGLIDLNAIDKNKDGKVFQDLMDWNVISDHSGECPLCKMELQEVSLDQAKENLIKHGFKVKK